MKKEIKNCIWTHQLCDAPKHLCCHDCKKKFCDIRCLDTYDSCKYKALLEDLEEKSPASFPSTKQISAIKEVAEISVSICLQLETIKKANKWSIADMAKIIEVPAWLIQKIVAKKSTQARLKVKKEYFDNIWAFLNTTKEILE